MIERLVARPALLASLWLLLLPALLFWEGLQPGNVLGAVDWIFSNDYFRSFAPEHRHPTNPDLFDHAFAYNPWGYYAWSEMRAGRLPLWNPDSYCGTPFLASMEAAVLFPINWLALLLPFEARFVATALLRLWIAGFGTYLLARHYRVGAGAALVAASSFMLSGFLLVWIGHPHTNVAVWLPWLVLAADRMLGAPSRSARAGAAACLALLVGIQFTGGHIESSADLLFSLALYCAARSWLSLEGPARARIVPALWKTAAWPGAAVALGFLLAAPQLLPFLEWLRLSNEFQLRSAGSFAWWDREFLRNLAALPVLAFPNLLSNPTWATDPSPAFLGGNFVERILYVGIIPLVLACSALWSLVRPDSGTPRQRWMVIWALIGAIAFGRAFRLPLFLWLDQLPLLRLGDPARNRLILSFSVCLLAAAGYEHLRQEIATHGRVVRSRWFGLIMVLLVAGALRMQLGSINRVELTLPIAFLAALAYLAAGWWRRPGGGARGLGVAIVALVSLDLLLFGRGFHPVTRRELFYPQQPGTESLRAARVPFRTTALDGTLIPDAHLMLGLSDVRGMDYPTRWYAQYMELSSDRMQRELSYGILLSNVATPLLRVLNIRYVLGGAPHAAQIRNGIAWRPFAPFLWLGELPAVQARSFMVSEAVRAEDSAAAELLRVAPERVFDRVILSDAQSAPELPTPAATQQPEARVVPIEYRAEASTWEITTPAPGYLVTTDSYYPGWEAYLDGVRVPLYRGNLAFRAVHVPAGHHRVEHRYEPRSFRIGVMLAAAALAIVAAMGSSALLASRRRW